MYIMYIDLMYMTFFETLVLDVHLTFTCTFVRVQLYILASVYVRVFFFFVINLILAKQKKHYAGRRIQKRNL